MTPVLIIIVTSLTKPKDIALHTTLDFLDTEIQAYAKESEYQKEQFVKLQNAKTACSLNECVENIMLDLENMELQFSKSIQKDFVKSKIAIKNTLRKDTVILIMRDFVVMEIRWLEDLFISREQGFVMLAIVIKESM